MAYQKSPEEVLKEAAKAAEALIPEVERQRDEAQKTAAALQAKITQLYAVVSAAQPSVSFGSPLQKKYGAMMSSTTVSSSSGPQGSPVVLLHTSQTPMTAVDKIATILASREVPLTTKELSAGLEKQFGQPMPQSTIYAGLTVGRKLGRFLDKNGTWTIAKDEGQ